MDKSNSENNMTKITNDLNLEPDLSNLYQILEQIRLVSTILINGSHKTAASKRFK
jgi:hypothetical protein